jgi:FkbM family methyltransferase
MYWNKKFLEKINDDDIEIIFEVGARFGTESIELSKIFKTSKIYSFECNPETIEICRKNLDKYENIYFFDFGLGNKNEELPFYSYNKTKTGVGASSFLKRIDYNKTQYMSGVLKIKKIFDFSKEYDINKIDLLCMDVQGFELNVLKGCETFLKNIKYIIMEQPKSIINTKFLPDGMYSKYINAPSSDEIKLFMKNNNFIEIERLQENDIEDNVMYKNTIFCS